MAMRRVRPNQGNNSTEIISATPLDDIENKHAQDQAPTTIVRRSDKPQEKSSTVLHALAALFFLIFLLAVGHGDAGRVGVGALKALGWWKRKDRVALLTVATHMSKLAETSDSESEYGSSKTAFSYPFSIDNKARYCELHQYDLNVDVHTDDSWDEEEEEEEEEGKGFRSERSQLEQPFEKVKRSSRFRKLKLIQSMWDSYDWLIWMDIDALFLDPTTDVLSLLDQNADIHFTLEESGNGMSRVNTGFFVIKTTEFAKSFFDKAWEVNDCGRGQSDQRSINYLLGIVNSDDKYCDKYQAKEEWEALYKSHFGSGGARHSPGADAAAATSQLGSHGDSGGRVSSMDALHNMVSQSTFGSSNIPQPGDQASKIRFYKKPLLNSFPKDVSKYLIPVDLYALPQAQGDERGASLVVHFAGQYGGARSLDGKMPVGMLVQYLHLLARYHSTFLDRVSAAKVKEAIRRGEQNLNQFHDDAKNKGKASSALVKSKSDKAVDFEESKQFNHHSTEGRHKPGQEQPLGQSGHEGTVGPRTMQDAVIDHSHEWTRDVEDAQARLSALESMLDELCLDKMRHYNPTVDASTGIAYYEPPRFPKPSSSSGGSLSASEYARTMDEYGQPRIDEEKTCDYNAVLSLARRHLGQFLPESLSHHTHGSRWPRSLLCAAPMGAEDLEARLGAGRVWLEMRKASTLSKLQHGAPYFEDDEYSLGDGFELGWEHIGQGNGGRDHGSFEEFEYEGDDLRQGEQVDDDADDDDDDEEEGGGGASSSFFNFFQSKVDEHRERHHGNSGVPLGPSLYASIDVATSATSNINSLSNKLKSSQHASEMGQDDESSDSEEEDDEEEEEGKEGGGGGGKGGIELDVSRGKLLVAVSECSFLDPIENVILESTFAFSANPEKQKAPKSAIYHFNMKNFLSHKSFDQESSSLSSYSLSATFDSFDSLNSYSKEGDASSKSSDIHERNKLHNSEDGVLSFPGVAFLPALPLRAQSVIDQIVIQKSKKVENKDKGNSVSKLIVDDNDDDNDDEDNKLMAAKMMFWTYTAPLMLKLMKELPSHIKIVTSLKPPFNTKYYKEEFERGCEILKIPRQRVVMTRELVYADMLLSLHTQESMDSVALSQLSQLKYALTSPPPLQDAAQRGSGGGDAFYDPYDDLVIVITEKPRDADDGYGTKIKDWFTVERTLKDALPEERVVRYDHSLEPDDYSSLEFFKRAKMIVVSAGVVPSLLMTMYSTSDIPIIELVGKKSLEHNTANSLGGHEGWDWTKQVANGFGMNRFTVKSRRTDISGNSLFDSQIIAEVARSALAYTLEETEGGLEGEGFSELEYDDDHSKGGNGEGWHHPEVSSSQHEKPEMVLSEEDDAEESADWSKDPNMPPDIYALIKKAQKLSNKGESEGKGRKLKVEMGLYDRDRFGELLERLGDSEEKENHDGDFVNYGGLSLGAEHGDFSLQLLRRWQKCPRFYILDHFVSSPTLDDHEPVSYSTDTRYNKLQQVLRPYFKSGVAKLVHTSGATSSVAAAAGGTSAAIGGLGRDIVADNSVSFIYFDEEDHSYVNVLNKLNKYWPKLRKGGIFSGHDFTQAHIGVSEAVVEFALQHGLTLYVTDAMRPRSDVLGNTLPPCCPSWYFFKSNSDGYDDSGALSVEKAARLITKQMNEESYQEEED